MNSPFPPKCAAKYRFRRLLAEGGYGAVYLAIQESLDRPVAVKILNSEAAQNLEHIARFMDEAKVTASLAHPNIVVILDHDLDEGIPWIVYEFISGPTLRQRLSAGPLPEMESLQIASQVAAALVAAHGHSVLHRDIKPENILQFNPDTYKVTDFGLATWATRGAPSTVAGIILGTPGYMAPELLDGEKAHVGSDIYATGVVLYELLTGKLPFVASSLGDLFLRQCAGEPAPPSSLRPELPSALDDLVLRAIQRSPAGRYESAAKFFEALNVYRAAGDRSPRRDTDPARGAEPASYGVRPRRTLVVAAASGGSMTTRVLQPEEGSRADGTLRPSRWRLPVIGITLILLLLGLVATRRRLRSASFDAVAKTATESIGAAAQTLAWEQDSRNRLLSGTWRDFAGVATTLCSEARLNGKRLEQSFDLLTDTLKALPQEGERSRVLRIVCARIAAYRLASWAVETIWGKVAALPPPKMGESPGSAFIAQVQQIIHVPVANLEPRLWNAYRIALQRQPVLANINPFILGDYEMLGHIFGRTGHPNADRLAAQPLTNGLRDILQQSGFNIPEKLLQLELSYCGIGITGGWNLVEDNRFEQMTETFSEMAKEHPTEQVLFAGQVNHLCAILFDRLSSERGREEFEFNRVLKCIQLSDSKGLKDILPGLLEIDARVATMMELGLARSSAVQSFQTVESPSELQNRNIHALVLLLLARYSQDHLQQFYQKLNQPPTTPPLSLAILFANVKTRMDFRSEILYLVQNLQQCMSKCAKDKPLSLTRVLILGTVFQQMARRFRRMGGDDAPESHFLTDGLRDIQKEMKEQVPRLLAHVVELVVSANMIGRTPPGPDPEGTELVQILRDLGSESPQIAAAIVSPLISVVHARAVGLQMRVDSRFPAFDRLVQLGTRNFGSWSKILGQQTDDEREDAIFSRALVDFLSTPIPDDLPTEYASLWPMAQSVRLMSEINLSQLLIVSQHRQPQFVDEVLVSGLGTTVNNVPLPADLAPMFDDVIASATRYFQWITSHGAVETNSIPEVLRQMLKLRDALARNARSAEAKAQLARQSADFVAALDGLTTPVGVVLAPVIRDIWRAGEPRSEGSKTAMDKGAFSLHMDSLRAYVGPEGWIDRLQSVNEHRPVRYK